MFTKSKEILSNDVHVKQMMLNAIEVTLSNFFYEYNFITKLPLKLIYRGGVLEDVLGLEDVLEDAF